MKNLQLFLHDAKIRNFTSCFKEKQFLKFLTARIKKNDLDPPRYPEFPFISPCGKEMNFIQCEDRPIVFTELIRKIEGGFLLSYNGAGELAGVDFRPELLSMDPKNGRVYYPAPQKELGKGLVRSSIAVELSSCFVFNNDDQNEQPKFIIWEGENIALQTESGVKMDSTRDLPLFFDVKNKRTT